MPPMVPSSKWFPPDRPELPRETLQDNRRLEWLLTRDAGDGTNPSKPLSRRVLGILGHAAVLCTAAETMRFVLRLHIVQKRF